MEKTKEHISSEPSGPHFGHFKAAVEDDYITEIDALIRTLPLKYGFTPKIWNMIVDVQILKKPGVFNIDKLRSIQLMHTEFNMNNKKMYVI